MMNERAFLWLCTFLLFLNQCVYGQRIEQDIYSRFSNYTVQDGLSSNQINDILQDEQGFIWIATDNGLNRFDGQTFLNYNHNPGDSLTILGNTVTSLALDNSKGLWVGTTNGLSRMSLKNGGLKHYKAVSGVVESPRTNHIRKIFFSSEENTLWIETLEGTLTEFNISNKKWEHYTHTAITQPYYRYHAIFQDEKYDIWLGGRNIPILQFDRSTKKFKTYPAKGNVPGGKRDNDVADILQTAKGDWYVVATDGIYQFYPERDNYKKLLATSTFSIAEDSTGIVWFGTGNGLYAYSPEASSFKTFQNNPNNSLSVIDNHVNKVFIDRVGNIWVGTRNGLSCLTQKSRLLEHYFHIPGVENGLSSDDITAMASGNNGEIYIGTANHGLNRWVPGKNGFEHFRTSTNDRCSISSDRISALYFDKSDDLWVGLWSGIGFNRFDVKKNCFTRYAMDYYSRKRDWYNSFLEDSKGNFWVGFWGATGVSHFDRTKEEFLSNTFTMYDKPYDRPVYQVTNDGNGMYFFHSNLPYVFVYDQLYDSYQSISFSNEKSFSNRLSQGESKGLLPFSFDQLKIYATNKLGTTAIGTNKGIIGYTRERGFFKFYQAEIEPISLAFWGDDRVVLITTSSLTLFSDKGFEINRIARSFSSMDRLHVSESGIISLVEKNTIHFIDPQETEQKFLLSSIVIDKLAENIDAVLLESSRIWVGTKQGLSCINHNFDSLTVNKVYNQVNKIIDSPVSFLLNSDLNFLIAFTPVGIYRVDKENMAVNHVNLKSIPEGFSTAVKTAEWIDEQTVWVGTENGHYQINLTTGELIQTNLPSSKRLSSHLVSTLMEDNQGNIWVGTTNKGLNRIDPASGFIQHFYAGEGNSTIPGNEVNATIQTADGRIWVGTNKGLCYIAGDFVVRVNDLNDNYSITSLIEDNQGTLWAGTNSGLVGINIYTGEIKIYDESYGFPSVEFSKAAVRLTDSRFAFGTSHGFVVFRPEELATKPDFGGKTSITQFSIFGKPTRFQFTGSDTITLDYTQNFFQINFSAFDFGQKAGAKYRYRLHKVNPDWVESNTSYVSYTNVTPGRYMFEVTKVLPDGSVSPNLSKLFIVIPPPFWQTIWFRALIILIIASGIGAYLLTYIKQLQVDRRNVELEQKLLISQMNPHFIFNSLTAIQSFMYSNDPEEAGNYLSSFSRLVRLILENSRSTYIPVKQEIQTLKLYLMLQKLRFPDKFDYEINLDSSVENADYVLPPLLAQPFIENSIEHGILNMEDKGLITISIAKEDDLFCITVEDNGVGIERSMEINQKKRLTHTSHATSITRERIKNISSSRDKRIGIVIDDLKKYGKEGTRIELRFPLKKREL